MSADPLAYFEITAVQLRAFTAVAEHGSFSAAAEALNVSQASISKSIKGLEAITGPLFERERGRRCGLLPSGEILRSELPIILRHLAELKRKINESRTRVEKITLGMGEYIYSRLRDAVSAYAADHSALNISVRMCDSPPEALRLLERGDLDLVIISQLRQTADPAARLCRPTPMKLYAAVSAQDRQSLDPLILPTTSIEDQQPFIGALRDMVRPTVDRIVNVPGYFTIRSMCRAGQGQAILFEEDASADVAEGRLMEVGHAAVPCWRCCYYLRESETLEAISASLMAI